MPRIALATLVMGSIIAAAEASFVLLLDVSGSSLVRIATLALLVVGGLGIYMLCLQAFGVASVRTLVRAVRERF